MPVTNRKLKSDYHFKEITGAANNALYSINSIKYCQRNGRFVPVQVQTSSGNSRSTRISQRQHLLRYTYQQLPAHNDGNHDAISLVPEIQTYCHIGFDQLYAATVLTHTYHPSQVH